MFDIPWQEFVFSFGGLIFFIALLPSIFSDHKPDFKTCLITASVITLFVYAFATLDMWVSMFGQSLVGAAWWVLTFQTYKRHVVAADSTTEE